jgi:hypothetical protein
MVWQSHVWSVMALANGVAESCLVCHGFSQWCHDKPDMTVYIFFWLYFVFIYKTHEQMTWQSRQMAKKM